MDPNNTDYQPGDDEFIEFGAFLIEHRHLLSASTAARWLRDAPERLPKTLRLGSKRFTTPGYIREWKANLAASAEHGA